MHLLPILSSIEENARFAAHPNCQDSLQMTLDFYKIIGFNPPWIGYYAEKNGEVVGACGYKSAPKNGCVEIAYYTFPQFQHQGIGGAMCRTLTTLALETDATVTVTARTLPEHNFSTRILEENGFVFAGAIEDEEDGMVWEWIYKKTT